MAELTDTRTSIWRFRLIFILLMGANWLLELAFLDHFPIIFGGFDLLLCVVLAWVIRSPQAIPSWLIGLMALTEDVLMSRPLGLWALIVVFAAEFLRRRVDFTRELNFISEWVLITGVIVISTLAYRLGLIVTFSAKPDFAVTIAQAFLSVLWYPFIVWVTVYVFRLRKPAMGEVDSYGRRL